MCVHACRSVHDVNCVNLATKNWEHSSKTPPPLNTTTTFGGLSRESRMDRERGEEGRENRNVARQQGMTQQLFCSSS